MRHALRFRFGLRAATLCTAGAIGAIVTACGGGYGGGGGGSTSMTCGSGYANPCPAPTVSVTAPASGATVSGTDVMLTASASASSTYGLTVTSVEFLIDGTSVGTATTSPYTFSWNSATVSDGKHTVTAKVTDSAGDTATSTAVSITVQNSMGAAVPMSPKQMFPAPASRGSGTADLTMKLDTGAVRGGVKLTGLDATEVTVNAGFAGATGPPVIRLAPSRDSPGEWDVPANALLTAEQVTTLLQGKLYVIATSAAHPRGEIRGQITPENVAVTFSALAPVSDAQSVSSAAGGVIATTVDKSAHTLSVHVNSTGVDDANAAAVDSAATGGELAVLTKDSVDMGHWSTELAPISAAEIGNFEAGKWYVKVATPVDANGAIRGQISGPNN